MRPRRSWRTHVRPRKMPFMRLPKLLMGSLLLVPLACGGDDGSTMDTGNDTGSGTASSMTANTMTMTAGDDDGVDDGVDDGMMASTTGEPPADGSSSGEPPADGSSSGEPPADSSGSGSDSGGAVSQECMDFCADYFEVCGESKANDYASAGMCEATCSGWTPAQFEDCRVPHLAMADGPNSAHCSHANIDGGGTCPAG
jgi:hypothetical protein